MGDDPLMMSELQQSLDEFQDSLGDIPERLSELISELYEGGEAGSGPMRPSLPEGDTESVVAGHGPETFEGAEIQPRPQFPGGGEDEGGGGIGGAINNVFDWLGELAFPTGDDKSPMGATEDESEDPGHTSPFGSAEAGEGGVDLETKLDQIITLLTEIRDKDKEGGGTGDNGQGSDGPSIGASSFGRPFSPMFNGQPIDQHHETMVTINRKTQKSE